MPAQALQRRRRAPTHKPERRMRCRMVQNLADICVNPRIMIINAGRSYALLKVELTFLGKENRRKCLEQMLLRLIA